ncbi:MAG: ABC transporter ATP-binding protein [Clostridia bacterium]|nr:ABC transporter ATP-binding protein [Clostridia bacterium]
MRVELNGVEKAYNGRVVLNIDKLEFERGKIYAVLGPNGSGKTTMLRIISNVDKCDRGKVCYNGAERILNNGIAYMPQKPYIFDMTVLKNILLGIGNIPEAHKLAQHALECVGMEEFANARARSLSGGEAQRVAVARTLAGGKGLILLDEPASAADISSMRLVEDYIKAVNGESRSTIIFTTHNPSQAARIADEIVFMQGGVVMEKGEAADMLNNPRSKEAKEFLQNWRI